MTEQQPLTNSPRAVSGPVAAPRPDDASTRPVEAAPRRRLDVAGAGWVTAGAMTANCASYLLHLPAMAWLGPDVYGVFASLLAAQLILAVPALAVQNVVARTVARGGAGEAAARRAYGTAAVVGVVAAVCGVGLAMFYGVAVVTALAAILPVPALVGLSAEQGVLQGQERFGRLGVVLGCAGVGKVVPAVAVLAVGGGVGAAFVASALGTMAVWALARWLRAEAWGTESADAPAATAPTGKGGTSWLIAVLAAVQVQGALMAFTQVDLLMAPRVLGAADAGIYASGAVITKIAFWLPAALGVILFPRMADPEASGGATCTLLSLLAGLGVVVVVGAAVCAPLLPLLSGEDYRPVVGLVWLFALVGVVLSLLQGLLLASVAQQSERWALLVWLALAIEVVVIATSVTTVTGLLTVALCGATGAVVAVGVVRWLVATGRRNRS